MYTLICEVTASQLYLIKLQKQCNPQPHAKRCWLRSHRYSTRSSFFIGPPRTCWCKWSLNCTLKNAARKKHISWLPPPCLGSQTPGTVTSLPQPARQAGPTLPKPVSTLFFLPFLYTLAYPLVHLLSLVTPCPVFLPVITLLAGLPQKSSPCVFKLLIPLNTPALPESSPPWSWKNPPTKRRDITKFPKRIHTKYVLFASEG